MRIAGFAELTRICKREPRLICAMFDPLSSALDVLDPASTDAAAIAD